MVLPEGFRDGAKGRPTGAPDNSDDSDTECAGSPGSNSDCSSGSSDDSSEPMCCSFSDLVAPCSNFAVQYNFACASMAHAIMLSHGDVTGADVTPDFPEPAWAEKFLLSVVFIGAVAGMLSMGYLGDLIGNRPALVVSNSMIVFGALVSAAAAGSPTMVWSVITAGRFVLGVGVGGNYPLTAARASHAVPLHEAVSKAGAAFFWQVPGSIAPYVLGLMLLETPSLSTSMEFRIILGAGALPALVAVCASLHEAASESEPPTGAAVPACPEDGGAKESALTRALRNPHHWNTLAGTAGTWFLFDVAFYGIVIFSPAILRNIFGADSSLIALAVHAITMGLVGLLGVLVGLHCVLPLLGARALNTAGLVLAGALFMGFAAVYTAMPEAKGLLFGFLCLLMGTLQAGPNIATYLLPVAAFPDEVRSTFHGLSSAAAKLGAMLGTVIFPWVADSHGIPAVMLTQAGMCIAGALVCHCLVTENGGESTQACGDSDDVE